MDAAGLAFDLLIGPQHLPVAIDTARVARSHVRPGPSGRSAGTFCKLSGMLTTAPWEAWRPYAEVVLEAFGPDRVIFGSDWPVCLLAASYADVVTAAERLTAGLPAAERAEVFGGTAARAYGLMTP